MRRFVLILPIAAFAAPAFAAGFDLPPRKPGQWEMSISVDAAATPPQVIRMCLDAETDRMLNNKFGAMAQSNCAKQEQKRDGDSIVLDSECKIGEMKAVSRSVVTGDFDSQYTMKTRVDMSGSNMTNSLNNALASGPVTQETTILAKRVGDCQATLKPGDIDLGGGRMLNVREMPEPKLQ